MHSHSIEPLCRTNAAGACCAAVKASKVKINLLLPAQRYKQRNAPAPESAASELLPSHTKPFTPCTPGSLGFVKGNGWAALPFASLSSSLPWKPKTAEPAEPAAFSSPRGRAGLAAQEGWGGLAFTPILRQRGFLIYVLCSVPGLVLSPEISGLGSR